MLLTEDHAVKVGKRIPLRKEIKSKKIYINRKNIDVAFGLRSGSKEMQKKMK